MRTTIRLNDQLLKKIKEIAVATDRTMTSVIEEAILLMIEARNRQKKSGSKNFCAQKKSLELTMKMIIIINDIWMKRDISSLKVIINKVIWSRRGK